MMGVKASDAPASTLTYFRASRVKIEAKLIVEIDGGQHDARQSADEGRTTKLEAAGYRVLNNIEGVIESIAQALAKPK